MNNDKLLSHMVMKNAKELADDMKVRILNKLIEVCEMKNHGGMILKEELIVIRDGVEKARKKEKDKEIKAIVSVIDNLVGRFGQEKDFEDKVEEECVRADKGVKKKGWGRSYGLDLPQDAPEMCDNIVSTFPRIVRCGGIDGLCNQCIQANKDESQKEEKA